MSYDEFSQKLHAAAMKLIESLRNRTTEVWGSVVEVAGLMLIFISVLVQAGITDDATKRLNANQLRMQLEIDRTSLIALDGLSSMAVTYDSSTMRRLSAENIGRIKDEIDSIQKFEVSRQKDDSSLFTYIRISFGALGLLFVMFGKILVARHKEKAGQTKPDAVAQLARSGATDNESTKDAPMEAGAQELTGTASDSVPAQATASATKTL